MYTSQLCGIRNSTIYIYRPKSRIFGRPNTKYILGFETGRFFGGPAPARPPEKLPDRPLFHIYIYNQKSSKTSNIYIYIYFDDKFNGNVDGKAKFIHTDGRVNIMRYFDTLTSVIIGQVLTESHLKKKQKDKLEQTTAKTQIYIRKRNFSNAIFT